VIFSPPAQKELGNLPKSTAASLTQSQRSKSILAPLVPLRYLAAKANAEFALATTARYTTLATHPLRCWSCACGIVATCIAKSACAAVASTATVRPFNTWRRAWHPAESNPQRARNRTRHSSIPHSTGRLKRRAALRRDANPPRSSWAQRRCRYACASCILALNPTNVIQ
jgi:hypothetical protein